MAKHPGRRSAAELSTRPAVIAERRPSPPGDLTEAQAAVWSDVVVTKPPDWFRSDTRALLAAYCRHVCTAADLSRLIDAHTLDLDVPGSFSRFTALCRARDRETRAALALARSLRTTQQSQIRPETAARKSDAATDDTKPWEFNDD